MHTDRPFLGILLMLGFCMLAPLGDSIAKLLGGQLPLTMLLLARFAIQVVLLLPLVWWAGLSLRLPKGIMALTWTRSALHIIGIGFMFSALRYLPLADALAIAFVMPFIMLLLGHLVLGEEVGRQRMIACGIGFIGTLLVIQPNFATVGWPALLPVAVAIDFALFMLVTRKIAKTLDPIALQTVSGLQASLMLVPVALLLGSFPVLQLPLPGSTALWLLAGLGVLGTIAHLMMTWSLRFAPAATLAPMQYLEIPFGTLIGWLIFKDLPNGLAALGICITVGAGLYIIARERRLSQRPAPTEAPSETPAPGA
ncbi:DMT family transporter [Yoonia sp. R2331]|uniref:DMT family transporter n=1 Tax=Yoonia sp. R2331 TaxID=3237238 RepID=UPI0034E4EF80